jgi:FkbM family methyltransferase
MRARSLKRWSAVLGALPDGVGQFGIAERVLAVDADREHLLTVRMSDGNRMSLDASDRTQGIAYLTRRFEPEVIHHVIRHTPHDGVFVDVGAHVGLVSFAVAARRPEARIFAFEPNPQVAARWRVNRELNRANTAFLVESALSDATGTAPFRLGLATDSGSGHLAERGTDVATTTLDAFADAQGIDRIDSLKIDVQGHEPAVLRGAEGMFARGAIGMVLVEPNDEPLLHSMLTEHGYVRLDVERTGMRRYRRHPPEGDASYVAPGYRRPRSRPSSPRARRTETQRGPAVGDRT